MGLHILLTAHTQQEEESAALENALSQPVKTRSLDFMQLLSEFLLRDICEREIITFC